MTLLCMGLKIWIAAWFYLKQDPGREVVLGGQGGRELHPHWSGCLNELEFEQQHTD